MAEFLEGPWVFEPHGAAGRVLGGEKMPFGYISNASPRVPIFEINNFLDYSPDDLAAYAAMLAAAPALYEALKKARGTINVFYVSMGMNEEELKLRLAYIDAALSLVSLQERDNG